MRTNWLDKKEYPFRSQYYHIDGHQLHYIDEGEGEILLFVHGTPSWSFEFRNIIKRLRQQYRCIAVDHIGFGLSDKPKQYPYSTQQHCRVLESFILAKQLHAITLVVHDFGGPIGLHFALAYPERISRLVILNSWLWSQETDAEYVKLRRLLASPLLPILYRYFNFSAKYLLPKSFGKKKLSAKLHRQYTEPFASAAERNGPLAFARSLLHDQDWFESLWNAREILENKPALLIWGMQDPFIREKNLKKFQQLFKKVSTLPLQDAGHFPHEEEPEMVAWQIEKWLQETD